MRLSPETIFVAVAIAGVAIAGVVRATATADDDVPLPRDAQEAGGFVEKRAVHEVPILEATRAFELGLGNGPVRGVAPDPARVPVVVSLLERELGRYPKRFFRKVRLAGLVLTDELREHETAIPSLPNVGGLLLLDVSGREIDLVRALHHEIWHYADLVDDGTLSPDGPWEALNPQGAAMYGSGGRTMRGSWAARPSNELPGFLSAYATSAVEEDKAETFAFVVARPEVTRERLKDDAVVAAKVQELERRLSALDPRAPAALGFPGHAASGAPPPR